ncbi:major facilitator superfamily domain-containing protein [Microdochium bolleyi]|uniref:Major facilitator superfamily domain-containing protein n=1 Tax=Microdochium bolleyi TaxID=196109 RepID=A0A136J1U8_9PEZI|nr:major facilitator superfamily domain-containing protein [Microdochium bolleyi]
MSGLPDGKDSDPERVSSHEYGTAHNKNTVGEGVVHEESAARRGLQMPAILAAMTPEHRAELEVKLRRRIDRRLMPMIVLMYILNYIDRNNIAAAKLAGLPEDLHLSRNSSEFQTAVSILFVGYLLMQIPSNLFLNKIGKPAIYLPVCMIVWGVISAATAGVHNFGGLIAIRFFLGFVEAAYFPGCLYYLSCWYTRKELGFRTAILYSGALISGAFSGLISAGITGNMDGALGYRAWHWLFIIEGVITIAIAFGAFFVLPNFPRTTSWLNEEEKALAIWRLEEDIGEDDWVGTEDQSFFQGAKLAFTDIKTYVLMVLVFCIVASGTVTNFFPAVVNTLGYGSVTTLLLTAPPYVIAVITTFLNAWHADKTGERYWHITLPLYVAIIAYIIAATTTSLGARYAAMMLMVPGVYTGYVVALAWISNTLPRPPAKRAAGLAFINAISNTSSIYASYMYLDWMAPRYIIAMSVNCATAVIAVLAATTLRFMLARLNKKLDQGIRVEGAINALPGQAATHGFRFKL